MKKELTHHSTAAVSESVAQASDEFFEQSGTSPPAVSERRFVGIAEWRERGVVPLSELYEHPDLLRPMPWDLRPYTAAGHISLLSAPPKVGKSTFMGFYAHAKASGGVFIGQPITQGRVLIVAPDESWQTIARRQLALGTPGDMVQMWFDLQLTIENIAKAAADFGASLVLLDTLARVVNLPDENDNAGWIRWFKENDRFLRDSAASWLFTHHDRKSGGTAGTGIRGASAIFGCVDIAFSLQRNGDSKVQRILRMEGTRFEQPDELVIEIDGDAYTAVGELETVSILDNEELMRVASVLTDKYSKVPVILERLAEKYPREQAPRSSVYRHLDKLHVVGKARRTGVGGQKDAFRYARPTSQSEELSSSEFGQADKTLEATEAKSDSASTTGGQDLSSDHAPRVRTSGQPASNRIAEQGQQLSVSFEETAGGAP